MRFIHMADVHFDSPFTVLASRENLANERRLEQRKAFADTIEYIKENQIPFLFISGDLYEQKYIRKSTIEYINNLFKEIPNTQIFISPGNHDPFLINSFYNTFEWNNNVTIFNSEIKIIETEEADIYGFGFTDFYCENSQIEKINKKIKFIKVDKRIFEEIKLNISEINSEEELIEKIKNVKTDKKRNYKIILEGYKNIEIDLNKIQKMVLSENILKVKDFSKVKYDIKELANQNNLKGVFINRILQKEEERLCTKEEAEQAIEIFINALK